MTLAMHAFLFVGGSEDARKREVSEFADKRNLKIVEFSISKIADVRELAGYMKLAQSTPTAILIRKIDDATPEALNAFLKNLEEPGSKITYLLTAKSEYMLISTIVSRCQLIRVGGKETDVDGKTARDFLNMSIGEKFKAVEVFRKREEAVDFLHKLTLSAHKEMVGSEENLSEIIRLIRISQNSIKNLNMNGNVGLNLTNLAVKTSVN